MLSDPIKFIMLSVIILTFVRLSGLMPFLREPFMLSITIKAMLF